MSAVSVVTSNHERKWERLGTAYTHEVPRIGEALIFRNNTWRVLDVGHPTENQAGIAIHLPWVKVVVEDMPWLETFFD